MLFVFFHRLVPLEITASFSASSCLVLCSGRAVHITGIAPRASARRTAQLRLSGHQAIKSGRPKKLPKQWDNTYAGTGWVPSWR